jgi:Transposase DDE domain
MPDSARRCTRLAYCQFLLSSQINYTMTHLAAHTDAFSHDAVTRFLAGDTLGPRDLWHHVQRDLVPSPAGYLVFDDTVLDKNHSRHIALVRRQWSGNEHHVIRGIGVVTCVYVNPELDRFWVIDYRLYAPDGPDGDGHTKPEHVHDMLLAVLNPQHPAHKPLPVRAVLMDAWYATRPLMRLIEQWDHVYYCPLKGNRRVDPDWRGTGTHRRAYTYTTIAALAWSRHAEAHGQDVHLKDFPQGHRVRLFRVVLSTEHTDYVATNDRTQDSTAAVHTVIGWRWKIEQLHREAKQLTGIERCQARRARSQRTHIACALLVWHRLAQLAAATQQTVYAIKFGQLAHYLRAQLRRPSVRMAFG